MEVIPVGVYWPSLLVAVQVGQATVSDDMFPAPRNVPAAQPVHSVKPVPVVNWPAGQSRQEVEAGSGWYLKAGQATHPT